MLTKHVHFIYDVFNNLIGEEDDDTGEGVFDHEEFYVVAASPQAPAAGKPTVEAAQPLLEFSGGGTLTERFLVAPDPTGAYAVMAQGSVASLNQGDVVIWMADDRQGTPRDVVNNSGTLANHIVFSELGADVYESGPSVTHWSGFAGGHLSAAAQLVLDGLRWYDPHQARWLSFDPTSFDGADANLARYAGNDPTNGLDRTGEISNTAIAAMVIFPWTIPAVIAREAFAAQPAVPAIAPQLFMPALPQAPVLAQAPIAPLLAPQQIIMGALGPPPINIQPGWAGAAGGGTAGLGIGAVMGGIGAGIIVVAAISLGAPVAAIGVTVTLVGVGLGAVVGAGLGSYYGSGQMTFGGGAATAATTPGTYWIPLITGMAWGYSAISGGGPGIQWPWNLPAA